VTAGPFLALDPVVETISAIAAATTITMIDSDIRVRFMTGSYACRPTSGGGETRRPIPGLKFAIRS
jgi:hypothetical protein